jgi:hypothetical protein
MQTNVYIDPTITVEDEAVAKHMADEFARNGILTDVVIFRSPRLAGHGPVAVIQGLGLDSRVVPV